MSHYKRSANSNQHGSADSNIAPPASGKRSSRSDDNQPRTVRDLKESHVVPILVKNLERGSKVTGKAIHEYLCRLFPGLFEPQLRTTQRMVLEVKAGLDEWAKNKKQGNLVELLYFAQEHPAGVEAQIDCTGCKSLGITINGEPFRGKIFTFKLSFSKWIYAEIVDGERKSAVEKALENALWELGGVPQRIRTDNGKALFKKASQPTQGFEDLCRHYGTIYSAINPGRPNENGSAETGNKTIKGLLRNRLMTDVEPDFPSREALGQWLREVLAERNGALQRALLTDREQLRRLPSKRVEPFVPPLTRQVNKEGMVLVGGNKYSVPRELHGKKATIRKYANHLTIYNEDGFEVKTWLLLDGEGGAAVHFTHVLHSLERKPGAFDGYRYREQMFPTERYKATYERLVGWYAVTDAAKIYIRMLAVAALSQEMEGEVDCALELLLATEKRFGFSEVAELVKNDATSHLARNAAPAQLAMESSSAKKQGRAIDLSLN